jgi:hypothetical protein
MCKALTQKTQSHFARGLLARPIMGHLGHIAIVEKLLAYNIVYSHSIQYCIHFYFYLLIPNMTQMTQNPHFHYGHA